MNKLVKYSLLAALTLGLSMAAFAKPRNDDDRKDWDHRDRHYAPEIDTALALGGLALVGGTLTVLRARRGK